MHQLSSLHNSNTISVTTKVLPEIQKMSRFATIQDQKKTRNTMKQIKYYTRVKNKAINLSCKYSISTMNLRQYRHNFACCLEHGGQCNTKINKGTLLIRLPRHCLRFLLRMQKSPRYYQNRYYQNTGICYSHCVSYRIREYISWHHAVPYTC